MLKVKGIVNDFETIIWLGEDQTSSVILSTAIRVKKDFFLTAPQTGDFSMLIDEKTFKEIENWMDNLKERI